MQISGLATPESVGETRAGRNEPGTLHHQGSETDSRAISAPTIIAIWLYISEDFSVAVMATIPAPPEDSRAEESYKIGDKVYYYKGGKIASSNIHYAADNAGLLEDWRKGDVMKLDSESSSNPVYYVRMSRKLCPQSALNLQVRLKTKRTKALKHLTR